MSVVVAVKKDGAVYFGTDSCSISAKKYLILKNSNNFKIWKVHGVDNCVIGITGMIRDACVLRIMDDLIDPSDIENNLINFKYVVSYLFPRIIEELCKYKYINVDKWFEQIDSELLFAYKDKLYYLSGDGAVFEIDDYIAIGSGKNEALASLYVNKENENLKERIIDAITASSKLDLYVKYPLVLMDTKDTTYEVIDN